MIIENRRQTARRTRFRLLKGTFYTSLPKYQIILRNCRGKTYKRKDPANMNGFGPSTKIHLSDYHSVAAEQGSFIRVTTDIRKVTCEVCRGCFLMGSGRANFAGYWYGLRRKQKQRSTRLLSTRGISNVR